MKKYALALCLVLLFSMTGCRKSEFAYSNETPITDNIKDFTNADNLTIDGYKEACYGEAAHRLYFQNETGNPVFMDSYFYFGSEGLHCFVEVHDNILSFNSKRKVYYNSSVELFFHDPAKDTIDNRTCQYRIDVGGNSTQLCGVKSKSSYSTSYFDGQFAVTVNGEINSSENQGFDVEVFIPWYELGFGSVEEVSGIMFYPAYNRVTDTQGRESLTSRTRTTKKLAFQATPHTWVPIEKNLDGSGSDGTQEGEFFGETSGYTPTADFDLSRDIGSNVGETELTEAGPAAYAFVKNFSGTNYYFECYVSDLDGPDSGSPKVGLVTILSGNRFALYLRKSDGTACGVVQRDTANSDWNWTVEDGGTYTNAGHRNSDDDFISGVKLALYRKDDLFCFFVNDTLYFSTDDAYHPLAGTVYLHDSQSLRDEATNELIYTEESIVGLYGWSATAHFSDYSLLQGEEANAKFNSLVH